MTSLVDSSALPAVPEGGWSQLSSWIEEIGCDESYCVTLVSDLDERESLLRFGSPPEAIQQLTLPEANALCFDRTIRPSIFNLPNTVVVQRYGNWILMLEINSVRGVGLTRPGDIDVPSSLSAGGNHYLSVHRSINADGRFLWRKGEKVIATYDTDNGPDSLDEGDGVAFHPYWQHMGPSYFNLMDDSYSDESALELMLLITGVRPQPANFAGKMLGAHWRDAKLPPTR